MFNEMNAAIMNKKNDYLYSKSNTKYLKIDSFSAMSNFNEESRLAMQEARDIGTGKIESKGYDSVEELMKDLLTDVDD